MKSVNLRELLTVAIDGELTLAERRAVDRALRESEAARALLTKLKKDSTRLRALPKVTAPTDLADNILNLIQDRALTPTPLPPSPPQTKRFNWAMLPVWVNFVTAAGVLIVVSIGAYSYFAASKDSLKRQQADTLARADDSQLPNHVASNDPTSVRPKPNIEQGPTPEFVVQGPRVLGPERGPFPRDVTDVRIDLGPPSEPVPEIESIQLDKIRVSSLFGLSEFAGDDAVRKKLVAEMKKDELIRLDLFCGKSQRGLERVLASLKPRGVNVVADSFLVDRTKKNLPTEIVIYTEALTAEEVTDFLAALAKEDGNRPDQEFTTLVAAPFLPADLVQLGKLLGVPNVLPKPAQGKKGMDITKPLPEGTANHVAATLSKMGTTTPPPKAERIAIVAAYSPMNSNPAGSKEIKQFLDHRGERKPNAKPLMLVLRTIK